MMIDSTPPQGARRWAWAALTWGLGWAAMLALDGQIDLANLAMLLVLASALASLWLPVPAALASSALAVSAFNWTFVPPRGSFAVDLHQHAVLLGAMLVLAWIIAALVAVQRMQAERARQALRQAEQLRTFGDALRDAAEPLAHASVLADALGALVQAPAALLLLKSGTPPADNDADAAVRVGDVNDDERAGLWHCLRQGNPMGPGTGRHDELPMWLLPLRGRAASLGAALLRLPSAGRGEPALRAHAQALCDQMGGALQRVQSARAERQARDQAQLQSVRNAMLAAISHDYRTPLATILGAASSLHDQGDRLTPEQRRRLSGTIVDETRGLGRLTDNTLQLARLDAPGLALALDWESAEDIVGTVMRRARQRDSGQRLRARLEPGLPLLRCDALLLGQMLDNLVDNAFKHTPDDSPVEILVRRLHEQIVVAVRDRGAGVAPAGRERIFEVFQRGAEPLTHARPGAGVGLAVCRAIARAHGGELKYRPRGHGGASFECHLPITEQPAS